MLLILVLSVLANMQPSFCIKITCYPSASCRNSPATTCRCDEQCPLYADCCADSPYQASRNDTIAFQCQSKAEPSRIGVYVKSVCPSSKAENWVREKCEATPLASDIELQVPVYSRRSSITYRNYFCALCNNDRDDLIYWDVVFTCNIPVRESEVTHNLEYSISDGTWTVLSLTRGEWVPCGLSPQLPSIISHYRECVSSIFECDAHWSNETVRDLCKSYEARLTAADGSTYKNFYCALCNHVDVDEMKCDTVKPEEYPEYDSDIIPTHYAFPALRPFRVNFGKLVDINLRKGNTIGKVKCPDRQVYDEYMKRCLETFCIGNRIPMGGRCVVA